MNPSRYIRPPTYSTPDDLPEGLLEKLNKCRSIGVVTFHSHLHDDELYTIDFSLGPMPLTCGGWGCFNCGRETYQFIGTHVASSHPKSADLVQTDGDWEYCFLCIMNLLRVNPPIGAASGVGAASEGKGEKIMEELFEEIMKMKRK